MASIPPLADFVRQVGGERVRVRVLVPPGQDPHTFTLKPSQLVALSRARLLVLNGLGLEFWSERLLSAVESPRLRVVRLGEGLDPGPQEPEAAGGEPAAARRSEADPTDAHGADPHVWLDPLQAAEMVERLGEVLASLDPAHAGDYRANAARFRAELATLDGEYRNALSRVSQRTFFVLHPGYGHLARRYGLRQEAVVKGLGEFEPSPARVAAVIRAVRRLGVRVIFAERPVSAAAARTIAEEAGIRVATLDPLGGADNRGYLATMRGNLAALTSALR